MRLSVLIPTYNCDCRQLVRQLQLQLPPDGELIVGDDCSTDADIRQKNSEIETLPGCRIFWAEHNMGRAAVRNALAREAKGEWLLFIDADAEVRKPSFITDYLSAVTSPEGNVDVVCGGTGNLSKCPSPSVRLRPTTSSRRSTSLSAAALSFLSASTNIAANTATKMSSSVKN